MATARGRRWKGRTGHGDLEFLPWRLGGGGEIRKLLD
jgi:hypothetical protein